MAIRYSKEEIKILSQNPNVKHIRENRLTLTFDFRLKLYDEWSNNQSTATLRKLFIENGLPSYMQIIDSIAFNFRQNGRPKNATNTIFHVTQSNFRTNNEDNDYLISTGIFTKGKRGIKFTSSFINEAFDSYPKVSIEESLQRHGIDCGVVGYHRIYNLKQLFDGNTSSAMKLRNTEETIEKYKEHPYVKRITHVQFVLSDQFYNDAYHLKTLHINKVLNMFGFDCKDLSTSTKLKIRYKLDTWDRISTDTKVSDINILSSINKALTVLINENFKEINSNIHLLSKQGKKQLCQWIKSFPSRKSKEFNKGNLIKKIGISRSNYYHILSNSDYGQSELSKESQDILDIEVIKAVINSSVYPKGSRLIYMMMKKITGKQFGRNKIMRLMRKYGLVSTVRKANQSRRHAHALLERNLKYNRLKRRFRLAHPLQHILTDVSYLKYSTNKTAYLSTVKDAVSGKILSCVVSDSNDLNLIKDTLSLLDQCTFPNASILHSDQGVLYLNESIQYQIKRLGLNQSMSKRGNCWDNASQESFFGHLKDECIFRGCKDTDEVRTMIIDYIDYYNNERPQWTRNKMTPNQYEQYIQNMNKAEFDEYYCKEENKYNLMVEKSANKARNRIKDIGV